MKHLLEAIENSIEHENWYAALAVSLMMPDICGKISFPESKTRYADWFDRYVGMNYKTNWNAARMEWFKENMEAGYISPAEYDRIKTGTRLTGGDCFALRCAYLHEGSSTIDDSHRAKEIVDKFSFHIPDERLNLHGMEKSGNQLVLQVDTFCNDIKEAVVVWKKEFEAQKPSEFKNFLMMQSAFSFLK